LCGAIQNADRVRGKVIKAKLGLSIGEHVAYQFDITSGDSSEFRIMNKLILDHVWKGSLNVEEESGGYLSHPPSIFDGVG
jgi:hypothetical protein